MEFTKKDRDDVPRVAKLVQQLDSLNADTTLALADEIFKHQPFFLSLLLGYRLDVTPQELDEIMRIYLLTWKYFRGNKKVRSVKITQQDYESVEDRNIAMLKYVEGEPDQSKVMNIYSDDLAKLESKALLAAIYKCSNERPVLVSMDAFKKGMILIGIKSFIECFEKL